MKAKSPAAGITPLANYPLVRRAGDFIFVSGATARQPDNTIAGAQADEPGMRRLDIEVQTEAVIAVIGARLADVGASLADLVELECYLVDMNDFSGFNAVYNRHFEKDSGPARATVAVHQLAHPDLLVEIRGVAWKPL